MKGTDVGAMPDLSKQDDDHDDGSRLSQARQKRTSAESGDLTASSTFKPTHPQGCEVCGSGLIDAQFFRRFGVSVCFPCRTANKDEFQEVTKTEAKAVFLLPEGTLRTMRFRTKANPRHSSWSGMKLYLRKQCREQAHKLYGDDAGIEEERKRRIQRRNHRKEKKREERRVVRFQKIKTLSDVKGSLNGKLDGKSSTEGLKRKREVSMFAGTGKAEQIFERAAHLAEPDFSSELDPQTCAKANEPATKKCKVEMDDAASNTLSKFSPHVHAWSEPRPLSGKDDWFVSVCACGAKKEFEMF